LSEGEKGMAEQELPPSDVEEQITRPARGPFEVISERIRLDASKLIERALEPEREEDEFDDIIKVYMKLAKVKLIMNLPKFIMEAFEVKEERESPMSGVMKKVYERIQSRVTDYVEKELFEGTKKPFSEEITDLMKLWVQYFKAQTQKSVSPPSFRAGPTQVEVTK